MRKRYRRKPRYVFFDLGEYIWASILTIVFFPAAYIGSAVMAAWATT